MTYNAQSFDIIVAGGGHAGCEAALASARLGFQTLLFAISLDSIAMMPCNPSIGGTSKGHLVREIDALGGEMGRNIDKTFIQSRMLNTSKGPAVYSLRAQADKAKYAAEMKKTLENTENLFVRQGEIVDILTENGQVTGVLTASGALHACKALILCTGTYVHARCLFGETILDSGPNGLMAAKGLRKALEKLDINLMRFKTGTPARIDKRSIDFTKMVEQPGDATIVPFSFETAPKELQREQISCYMAYTNEKTHAIIQQNIHRSPMYSGVIEGTGTRYCPSIEDKIVRFADKSRHQLFIEPEGENTNEMYVQGMSSSLPEDVQLAMYQSIEGLENCRMMRTAYAIEYDVIDATQLDLSLQFKHIKGLYSAGQFNGSSGYEEAAAQGLMAGINAARALKQETPVVLDRSQAYIGVLIDDLVTKGTQEPYRMMTSRAEYRLLLRQDNADLRLTPIGYDIGLIGDERFQRFEKKRRQIQEELLRAQKTVIVPSKSTNSFLADFGSTPITTGVFLADLARRPEIDYVSLAAVDRHRPGYPQDVFEQAGIQIKYQGYIQKQMQQVQSFQKLEAKALPADIDYEAVTGISTEARQKLGKIRPRSVGHASRISGVSPADISVLLVFLAAYHKKNKAKG